MSQNISHIPNYQPLDSLSKELQDQIQLSQQYQQNYQPQQQLMYEQINMNPLNSNGMVKGYSLKSTASPIVDSLSSSQSDLSIISRNNFKQQQQQKEPQQKQLKHNLLPFSSFQGQLIDNQLPETQPAQQIHSNRKNNPQLHSHAISTKVLSFVSTLPQISHVSSLPSLSSVIKSRIIEANGQTQETMIGDNLAKNNNNSNIDIINEITISLINERLHIRCANLIQQIKALLDTLQDSSIHVNGTDHLATVLHKTEKQLSFLRSKLLELSEPKKNLYVEIENVQDISNKLNVSQGFVSARVNRSAEYIHNQDTQQVNPFLIQNMNSITHTPPSPVFVSSHKKDSIKQDYKSRINNLYLLSDNQSLHQMNNQTSYDQLNIKLLGSSSTASASLKPFEKQYSFHQSFVSAMPSYEPLLIPFDFRSVNTTTNTITLDQNFKNISNSLQSSNEGHKQQLDKVIIEPAKPSDMEAIKVINVSADKESIQLKNQQDQSQQSPVVSSMKSSIPIQQVNYSLNASMTLPKIHNIVPLAKEKQSEIPSLNSPLTLAEQISPISLKRSFSQAEIIHNTFSSHETQPTNSLLLLLPEQQQQPSIQSFQASTANQEQKQIQSTIITQPPQLQSSLNNTKSKRLQGKLKSSKGFFLPLYTYKDPFYYSLSNFSIGKQLGHGKFAKIFSAFDKETGFRVALKQIKKQTISEFKLSQDVINEIRIQSQLSHRNIIQLYGFFADTDAVYLIQELACGQELFADLKSQPYKKYTENQASLIVKDVIEALIYMQQKNVIHRDIKPENIIIDNIKICDFGCAAYIKDNSLRKTFCGTLDYISPEMISSQPYDYSVDVWSVGILTYELIFGNAPFKGKDLNGTFNKIVNSEFQFDGPVSFEARDFIQKILEKDASKRITIVECLYHPFINGEQLKRRQQEQKGSLDIADINML